MSETLHSESESERERDTHTATNSERTTSEEWRLYRL